MGTAADQYLMTLRQCLDMPEWVTDEVVEEIRSHFEEAGSAGEQTVATTLGSPRRLAGRLNTAPRADRLDWPVIKVLPLGGYERPRMWVSKSLAIRLFMPGGVGLMIFIYGQNRFPWAFGAVGAAYLSAIASPPLIQRGLQRLRWREVELLHLLALPVAIVWILAATLLSPLPSLWHLSGVPMAMALVATGFFDLRNYRRCRAWLAASRPDWALPRSPGL